MSIVRALIAGLFFFITLPAFGETNTLVWVDNSGNDPKINDQEEGFKIYRSINGGPFVALPTIAAVNVTSFIDNIAATNIDQQVCYQVTAVNSAGESAPSNQACKLIARLPWVIPASPTQASVK